MLRETSSLGSVLALVRWDQETYMPPAGAAARAEQVELVSKMLHERKTSKRLGELISACESDASVTRDAAKAANLREIRRDYDLATKLPSELVAELAKTASLAQEAWKHAREQSDFAAFRPMLEKMMTLTRRKAQCLGGKGELYDALLNEYEPGITAREIEAIFTPLRRDLTEIVKAVAAASKRVKIDTSCINERVDPAKQHAFGQAVLGAMGFDLQAGRLDTTTHPFCEGLGPGDTRLTTRYRGERFTDALYGTMHEGGHGIYEQGLPKSVSAKRPLTGQPLAEAISLGIHESQSRMWENFVGRSMPFWTWAAPRLTEHFGPAFRKHKPKDLYKATSTTTPSFIRVEADEGTYNMHVMIRFEIERGLIAGDVAVKDVPRLWNAMYRDYLGVKVPDDRRGCLQDVHWSFGLIGYFPTYTLGNLYAAQFWEKINQDMPTLPAQIARGEMLGLRDWLNANIHRHGRRYRAAELCQRVTGKPLSAQPLLRHLRAKAKDVYGV
jgi:carboxypeptidase Taq